MAPRNIQLRAAIRTQLHTIDDNYLRVFSSILAANGGTLPSTGHYLVPAVAVLLALGKKLDKLLEGCIEAKSFSLERSRGRAENTHAVDLASAAQAALGSESQDAAILSAKFRLSTTSKSLPYVTDRSSYEALLQAAADTVGVPPTKKAAAAGPGAGLQLGEKVDVLALHFPSVTPVMSMEDKAAAILAAVCSQLGRAVPLTADQEAAAAVAAASNGLHGSPALPPPAVAPAAAPPASATAAAGVTAAVAATEAAAGTPDQHESPPAAAAASGCTPWTPHPALEWDLEDATARHLAEYEEDMKAKGPNWAFIPGKGGGFTLLGALLHALKLTQPWDIATAGLAAGDAAADNAAEEHGSGAGCWPGSDPAADAPSMVLYDSSSGLSRLEHACRMIQGSSTMRALWPSLMEMIKQGHLEQPFYTDQLFFIGDIALQQNSDVEGEGGSATVYVVTLGDNSKRAIKCFHPKTLLRCVDQEVHALQVATSQGCKYVLGLEGMALLASSEQRLLAGLVLQHGDQTLWDQVRYGGRMQDEEELRAVLFQMLLGVYELHFHHVWHRDLSPANFLQFDAKPGMPFTHYDRQLMVIDLGASKLLDMLRTHQPVSVVFTPGFGAPEYVKGRDSHSGSKPESEEDMPEGMQLLPGSHTTWHKTDMWSLGAIAVYLWWGLVPNWLPKLPTAPLHTPQEVVSQVQEHCAVQGQRSMREEQRKRQQREKRLGNNATAAAAAAGCEGVAIAWEPPQGLLEFLSGCLLADPTKRKTARELLALPWFEGERARVLERAQERGPVIPPASPTAAGTAASTSSNSWGPALEALLDEWRSA